MDEFGVDMRWGWHPRPSSRNTEMRVTSLGWMHTLCTITRHDGAQVAEFKVPFSMGPEAATEPALLDVLDCVVTDAQSLAAIHGGEEWLDVAAKVGASDAVTAAWRSLFSEWARESEMPRETPKELRDARAMFKAVVTQTSRFVSWCPVPVLSLER